MNTTSQKSKKTPSVFLSVAICFLLLVFAPLDIYATNTEDFVFDCWDILRMMIPAFLLSVIILCSILLLARHFSKKIYLILLIIVFSFYIATYVQGTFFSSSLSIIDGRNTDWSSFSSQNTLTVVLWIILFAGCFFAIRFLGTEKFESVINSFSVFFTVFLLLSSVLSLSLNDGFRNKNDIAVTDDGLLSLSGNKNFIIFVVDTTDSTVFKQLLDEHPEYKDCFHDFTFYGNTMSLYGCTKYSIPSILTGQIYQNEESFFDFQKKAYSGSPLFAELEQEEYSIGLYEPDLPSLEQFTDETINVKTAENARFLRPVLFIKMQLKLAGLKYLPYFLKPYCTLSADNIYYDSAKNIASDNLFSWQNNLFYRKLLQIGISTSDNDNAFRFIHLSGSHLPYDEYNSEINGITGNTYETSTEATVTVLSAYIQNLRDLGIYDNSIIMIMADHGFLGSYDRGHQNPILLIKGFNENHPFVVSSAPISFADLIDAYPLLLSGQSGNDVFDYSDGEIRTRQFFSIYVADDNHMYEFSHHGDAADESLMVEERIHIK